MGTNGPAAVTIKGKKGNEERREGMCSIVRVRAYRYSERKIRNGYRKIFSFFFSSTHSPVCLFFFRVIELCFSDR